MKICKIIIKDFHQFKDFELDLTHPETGEPLDKVCLIGSNGTGKTKLLELINSFLTQNKPHTYAFYKIKIQNQFIWAISTPLRGTSFFVENIQLINDWQVKLARSMSTTVLTVNDFYLEYMIDKEGITKYLSDSTILIPAESNPDYILKSKDVPNTNVDEALKLFSKFPVHHIISNETIIEFWKTLIYHLKKRDSNFHAFQNLEENQNRTVREVREEFDKKNHKILDEIAVLWNSILGKAGLEFDVESASNPIQLTDNLKAYIKLKSTGKRINYNDLSTGIRNFIFKVGHIYSLYFNRNIEKGFLLIDEPENSLFPDFLYDLVDIYESITSNTQIFMATHSPIIAAQFEPYERFILEFDNHGHVQVRRGTVPVGDDPNDILSKDFGVRSLLGKEGVKKWERYIELRTIIRMTQDMEEKSRLLDEFMKIGNEYNFSNALS